MRYYAVENQYGSSTSHGFCNTWDILVFNSKKARDSYVNESTNITTKSIKKAELSLYTRSVKPFSGEALIIIKDPNNETPGLLGCAEVAYPEYGERLYK